MGDLRYVFATVTFDSSYDAGGEDLTAATLGFQSGAVYYVSDAVFKDATTGAVVTKYNYTTSKLQAFWDEAPAGDADFIEVTAATNLAAYSGRVFALGR